MKASLREIVDMDVIPVDLSTARAFVSTHHRHNDAAQGWKFGAGIAIDGVLRGVAMVGRPIAQALASREPRTVEITRVCVLGDRNANSRLYGAACRMAASGGYVSAITYTLPGESGASLRAAGFYICDADAGAREGQTWNSAGRPRAEENLFGELTTPPGRKTRWRRWLRHSIDWIPNAWSRDTSADPEGWTTENPAYGQCAVTALVVQEILGGQLRRATVNGISHYWNALPDGRHVDLTVQQFDPPLLYDPHAAGELRDRDYVLAFTETAKRYRRLVARGLAIPPLR